MTSKQRAHLRSMANTLEPIFQIGKSGISDNLVQQLIDALAARELIKIHVLETAPDTAKELGIKVINEVEMAYSFLDKSVNIIGVTGSNGKTTTTTLISEFMKNSFDNVYLGGNIGIPLSNFVRDIKSNSYLVLEISDHQLCDMYDFKTNVSVLTNITPTHLDFHKSYEVYQMTKKKISYFEKRNVK